MRAMPLTPSASTISLQELLCDSFAAGGALSGGRCVPESAGFATGGDGLATDTGALAHRGSASSPDPPEPGANASMRSSVIVKPAYSSGARPISLRPCTAI
jgi:hypothetical protein